MLEARKLTKRFGDAVALEALDLTIPSGEIYCLLGANGAGKSTTIKLFLDFLPRTSGEALIGGLDVAQAPIETKRLTAYVPEIVHLYPTLTGLENVEFFARLAGVEDLSRTHLSACLAKAGVPAAAVDRPVGGYSKGMRQKVGLAIAVAKRARALMQLAAGSLDLSFVVIYLAPLALVVLGFGVLATDRERGALAMLLSQPVSARSVAWTRLLLRAGLVYAVVATVALVAVADAVARGDAPFDGWRLTLWLAGAAAYVVLWTTLIAAVAALDLEADASALSLVALWLLLTIVTPSLASLAARYVAPLPSRLELVTELRAAENAANARSRALLQGYMADHPELQGAEGGQVAPFVKTFFLVQRSVDAEAAPIRARYEEQRRAQASVVAAMRYLSPALLTQGWLQEAAGTGPSRYEAFRHLAVEERARWLAAVEKPLMQGRRLSLEQYDALPRATVPPERPPDVARRVLGPALALAVLALALGAGAQRRLPQVRAQE